MAAWGKLARKVGVIRYKTLEDAIESYSRRGYIVTSQTANSAQLVHHKQFSIVWALLTAVVPYLLYHVLVKREDRVYLRLEGDRVVIK